MITVAPGTAAPEESVMAPPMDPPTTCACDGATTNTTAAMIPAMAGEVMERIALISRSRDEKVCWWRGAFYDELTMTLPVRRTTTTGARTAEATIRHRQIRARRDRRSQSG